MSLWCPTLPHFQPLIWLKEQLLCSLAAGSEACEIVRRLRHAGGWNIWDHRVHHNKWGQLVMIVDRRGFNAWCHYTVQIHGFCSNVCRATKLSQLLELNSGFSRVSFIRSRTCVWKRCRTHGSEAVQPHNYPVHMNVNIWEASTKLKQSLEAKAKLVRNVNRRKKTKQKNNSTHDFNRKLPLNSFKHFTDFTNHSSAVDKHMHLFLRFLLYHLN